VRFWGAILLVGFAIAFAGPWVDPATAGSTGAKAQAKVSVVGGTDGVIELVACQPGTKPLSLADAMRDELCPRPAKPPTQVPYFSAR
jgi:hypothetical protein